MSIGAGDDFAQFVSGYPMVNLSIKAEQNLLVKERWGR
jgi:hypothetical protein